MISTEKIAIITIGVVIAILLLIIVILLIVRMLGKVPVIRLDKKVSDSWSHSSVEFARRLSRGSAMPSERSSSIYFQPTMRPINSDNIENSRIIIVGEDINNYTNRYDIVLLKGMGAEKSVSMSDLDETQENPQKRKPRRSLPANTSRYIVV